MTECPDHRERKTGFLRAFRALGDCHVRLAREKRRTRKPPRTPFDMPDCVLDSAVGQRKKQAQAEQLSAQALTTTVTATATALTILFATVLFFAAVSL